MLLQPVDGMSGQGGASCNVLRPTGVVTDGLAYPHLQHDCGVVCHGCLGDSIAILASGRAPAPTAPQCAGGVLSVDHTGTNTPALHMSQAPEAFTAEVPFVFSAKASKSVAPTKHPVLPIDG